MKRINKVLTVVIVVALALFIEEFGKKIIQSNVKENTIISNVSIHPTIYLIGQYTITKIVDGDTVHVKDASGKEDVVRMLIVNTPEIRNASDRQVCLGNISKTFVQKVLLNEQVTLWGDTTQPKRDKYDRLVAYIQIGTSTKYFNESLMKEGYAKVFYATPTATLYDEYLGYQKQAQAGKIGMWNLELCK